MSTVPGQRWCVTSNINLIIIALFLLSSDNGDACCRTSALNVASAMPTDSMMKFLIKRVMIHTVCKRFTLHVSLRFKSSCAIRWLSCWLLLLMWSASIAVQFEQDSSVHVDNVTCFSTLWIIVLAVVFLVWLIPSAVTWHYCCLNDRLFCTSC